MTVDQQNLGSYKIYEKINIAVINWLVNFLISLLTNKVALKPQSFYHLRNVFIILWPSQNISTIGGKIKNDYLLLLSVIKWIKDIKKLQTLLTIKFASIGM